MKRKFEKGFTLIELLIVVAVLGALAAVVVPAVGSFLVSAKVTAANTEAANVKTAAMSYLADNGKIPHTDGVDVDDSDLLYPGTGTKYLSELPKYGKYEFHPDSGQITAAEPLEDYEDIMIFKPATQSWERKP